MRRVALIDPIDNDRTTLNLDLDRLRLGKGPTPVRELTALSLEGVAPVWIKDDGVYGRHGGNKARKLEWLLGDAIRRGRRTIITGGAIGTNHGLATALYAREMGLRTILVLVPQPQDDHVSSQVRRIRDSGAEVHMATGPARAFALAATLIVRRAVPSLRVPYLILPGGSVPLGCLGYVEAGLELGGQVAAGEVPEPSHVIVALGSGGTAAGLLLGLRLAGLRSRLVAVLVNDLTPLSARGVARLARRTQRLVQRHSIGARPERVVLGASDLDFEPAWLGDGYGHPTPQGAMAIEQFRREGVVLEPVYTAKAAAALIEMNRLGRFADGPVLFWHTYGAPSPASLTRLR